jgi:hypothetical protein
MRSIMVWAPEFAIFLRKPNRDIDAGPCCEGFYAAMKLRLSRSSLSDSMCIKLPTH